MLLPRPAAPMVVVLPTASPSPSPAVAVVVHVVGAVARPGIYRFESGARADDAVQAAGGLLEDADPASLNLAARLVDGQQVVVRPRTVSTVGSPLALPPGDGGRLDLNSASLIELDSLPGVGPVLAQRIVERRQRLGPFRSVDQLRDEKILSASTYERIKELIEVR